MKRLIILKPNNHSLPELMTHLQHLTYLSSSTHSGNKLHPLSDCQSLLAVSWVVMCLYKDFLWPQEASQITKHKHHPKQRQGNRYRRHRIHHRLTKYPIQLQFLVDLRTWTKLLAISRVISIQDSKHVVFQTPLNTLDRAWLLRRH